MPFQNLKSLIPALFLVSGAMLHGQNLVTNGDFENGFSGWSNYSGGTSVASYSLETASPYQGVNSMKALVTTAGANPWEAQSLGPSFATTVGTEYTMTFYAKAALANTSIRMVAQDANYLYRNFSLSTQWTQYTWTFTAVETKPRLRIHYVQAGTFWIDNISVVPTASIPVTLTIKPEIRHQQMLGFGGSLTWYRERVLNSPHSAAIKQLLFEDLGLDIIRFKNWYYPNDYPTNKSSSDPASQELHDAAKAANPAVKMLLSSWSPPVSLKSNGSLNNGGTLARNTNGYRYAEFAQYWVDALDRLGWEPDYLSFQNEPGYVAAWKSCIFRPTQTSVNAGYAEASDAIYNAIKDRPSAPIMIGAELETIGSATWSDWKNGAQVNRFREMNTPLRNRSYIGAHAYHTYDMQNESHIDGTIPLLNMIRDEFSGRPNFMTEYSNDNYDWLAAARVVHNTVVEANASAYLYWKLVWDPSASSMIGISWNGDYTVGPHYHMLKHYSKHVSIGHRRIEVSGSTSDVKISGFINPAESEITLVVINNSSSAKNVDLVQTSLPVRGAVAYQSVANNYFQNLGAVDLSGAQTLPARSMTTYVVSTAAQLPIPVPNAGFESPNTATFLYNPTGASWTFHGGSGISRNWSAFTSNNSPTPEGFQVAFLQGADAEISTQLDGLTPGSKYLLIFSAAQRAGNTGQTWNANIGGSVIGSFAPPNTATNHQDYTATFTASATSSLLAFSGTNLNGGDNTVLIDNVRIVPLAEAPTNTLLADSFDTVGVGNTGFNQTSSLLYDQSGPLAPRSYSINSDGWDGYIQRGVGGRMLLAGYDASVFNGRVFASLNHNFAADANTLNSPLEIKFHLDVTDSADPNNWGAIAVGPSQNLFVNNPANKFSSLFRDSGGTQQFASGAEIGSSMTFTDGDEITLLLSDTAGTGSAFNGNGSVAKLYINGDLQATFPNLGLGASDGYITFQANGTKAYYDNLVITATSNSSDDPFYDWMTTNYPAIEAPDNAPTADPDNDGIANLLEYILQGGDPSVSNTGILPTLDASGENFIFTYYRRAAATGTIETFEYGTSLSTWTPVAIPGGPGVTVTQNDPSAGIDKVEITVAKGAETKLFGRLKVTQPESTPGN